MQDVLKNSMRIILIAVLVLAIVLLPASFALSQEGASDIVRSQIISASPNMASLKAYRWPAQVLSAKEAFSEPFEFDEPVWFFWIDDAPDMQFSHPNRFVFVYSDGFVKVLGANWYPENLSEGELFFEGKPGIFERLVAFFRGLL